MARRKTFAVQFVVFNVIEDTGFYWIHRAFHHPKLYRKYHKVHHSYDPPFRYDLWFNDCPRWRSELTPLLCAPVLGSCSTFYRVFRSRHSAISGIDYRKIRPSSGHEFKNTS